MVASLALTLVASTTCAAYCAARGPQTEASDHCQQRPTEPERQRECCTAHLTSLPGRDGAPTLSDVPAILPNALVLPPAPAFLLRGHTLAGVDARRTDRHSLVAQHTSLQR